MAATPKSELTVLQESQGLKIDSYHGSGLDSYMVKSWTLRQLIEVAPVLQEIAEHLQHRGITLDQLTAVFDKKESGKDKSWGSVLRLFQTLLPCLPGLLSTSLNVPVAEMEDLDSGDAVILTIRVLKANIENVSRFFGQMVTEIQGALKKASTP